MLVKKKGVYKSYKCLERREPLTESEYVRLLVESEGRGVSSDEDFVEVRVVCVCVGGGG